jgi:hypothetical protein
LRALSPTVFLVVGWSRGREVLLVAAPTALRDAPTAEPVTLVAEPGSSATLLAAFLLDLVGVPLERLSLVRPDGQSAGAAIFEAADEPAGPRLPRGAVRATAAASTTEARDLVPIVAVTPHRFLRGHGEALRVLARRWLESSEAAAREVPGVARRLAEVEGAPEALEMLGRLDRIAPVGLAENATLFGLAGRRAATVDALYVRVAALFSGLGVLADPVRPPDAPPVTAEVVADLVRQGSLRGAPGSEDPPLGRSLPGGEGRILLAAWLTGQDLDSAIAEVGLLADVFSELPLRIVAPQGRADELAQAVTERYGLTPGRVEAVARPLLPGAEPMVEVLAP